MVLLRGLFGGGLSYLPTVLNVLQCVGWGVFELVTIATAAHTVAPSLPRWGYVLIAGAATGLLTVRPLGSIRVLRRYVTGAVVLVLALALNIADYENFLVLLGSVFVPMFAVLAADFFVVSRGHWDLSASARTRWLMLVPWAAGFAAYQLVNPGYISWWASAWTRIARLIGFIPASWMSASVLSFCVAGAVTLLTGLIPLPGRRPAP